MTYEITIKATVTSADYNMARSPTAGVGLAVAMIHGDADWPEQLDISVITMDNKSISFTPPNEVART